MHHDGIAFADQLERVQRLAARNHVVFADDLEPVDVGIAAEDFVVVLMAKPETEAEEGRLCRLHRAVCKRRSRTVWQSACDVHVVSA